MQQSVSEAAPGGEQGYVLVLDSVCLAFTQGFSPVTQYSNDHRIRFNGSLPTYPKRNVKTVSIATGHGPPD